MSGVGDKLGLSLGQRSPVLMDADRRWSGWRAAELALQGPAGVCDLRGWLRDSEPAESDRVLRGLVRIGSPRGLDDVVAVSAVAWALLPGAQLLAHQLRSLGPETDELVAAELWVQIRGFAWERLGKVAANVLANTRAVVLADALPDRSRASRGPRPRLVLVDPHSPWWERTAPASSAGRAPEVDRELEVATVLAEACSSGAVTSADRALLLTLLDQAALTGGGAARRGQGGLLAGRVVDPVATTTGLSPATVRRRVRRSIFAIQAACRTGLGEAA